jgi:hypothetical protein
LQGFLRLLCAQWNQKLILGNQISIHYNSTSMSYLINHLTWTYTIFLCYLQLKYPPSMSFCSPPHVIQNHSIRNPGSSSRSFSNGLRWKIKLMSLMLLYKNKQVNHIGTYGLSKQNGRWGIHGWHNYDLKLVGKNDVLLAFVHMPKHMGYGRVQIYALFFCQRS